MNDQEVDFVDRPHCLQCGSGCLTGYGKTDANGGEYFDWVCDKCGNEFRVIEVFPEMKSLAEKRANKRHWWTTGRRQ